MTETQKRIRAYKKALPALRERVIAVALLLAMSTAMMASASFAWLTLSLAPEVTGAATQIAGNGNLEIALANKDGSAPGESKVGDSSAAEGQTLLDSNLTWGNLINLADPEYGLSEVVLRPAELNPDSSKRAENPFVSVDYGADGRAITGTQTFSFFTYDSKQGRLAPTGNMGVRVIAKATEEYEGDYGNSEDLEKVEEYKKRVTLVNQALADLNNYYRTEMLVYGSTDPERPYVETLFEVMGLYMTYTVNFTQTHITEDDYNRYVTTEKIGYLADMFLGFGELLDKEMELMVRVANLQQYAKNKGITDDYTPLKAADLQTLTTAQLAAKGVQLSGLEQWKKDRATVENCIYNIVGTDADGNVVNTSAILQVGSSVRILALKSYIDQFVNVGTSEVLIDGKWTAINSIGGTIAIGLDQSKTYQVRVKSGVLANFEKRTGCYCELSGSVTATGYRKIGIAIKKDLTLKCNVYTQHKDGQSNFSADSEHTTKLYEESGIQKGDLILVPGESYGLALDLYVRTNADVTYEAVKDTDSDLDIIAEEEGTETEPEMREVPVYLVLEGEVLYEQAKGKNESGQEMGLLFEYAVMDETTGTSTTYQVYETEDGKVYEQNTSTLATIPDGTALTAVYLDAPTGYQGVNRIWTDEQAALLQPSLPEFSTTQGAGSSFTFYSSSPTEQASILNLLSHMRVVFMFTEVEEIDGVEKEATKNVTGQFQTGTNQYYAQNGKITVPLKIAQSDYVYVDENKQENFAIMTLDRNVATRLTVLLYLNGTELTNKEALALSDMQGTLNLQFGTTSALNTLGDDTLQIQECVVDATVTTANADNKLNFFTDTNLTADVTVAVSGSSPKKVTGFFLRAINDYQGTREQLMTFSPNDDGTWSAQHTFTAPGNYILRSVMLDGIEYELLEPRMVEVEGFTVGGMSVKMGDDIVTTPEYSIMTADNSVDLDLELTVATNDANRNPRTVRVELLRSSDSSVIAVDMHYDGKKWVGSTTINSSGEYTMSYVLLDDVPKDLGGMSKNFDIDLGLKANVFTINNTDLMVFLNAGESKTLEVGMTLLDGSNQPIPEQSSKVTLFYRESSSRNAQGYEMTWNGTRYEGNIHITNGGVYVFDHVEVGDNYIGIAARYPTFQVVSNSPVEYVGCGETGHDKTVFAAPGSSDKVMTVSLKNSSAAKMIAVFTDGSGKEHRVYGDMVNKGTANAEGVTEWTLTIPKVNGSQQGNWTLVRMELSGVRDGDGIYYTAMDGDMENAPDGVWDNGSTSYLTIVPDKVASTQKLPSINIISDFRIEYTGGKTYGDQVDTPFMTEHTVDDLSISFYYMDEKNERVPLDITSLSVTYTHDPSTMDDHGSYTSNSAAAQEVTWSTEAGTLVKEGDTFKLKDAKLRTAGEYNFTELTYRIGEGNPINLTAEQLKSNYGVTPKSYVVKSAKPTVTITGVSPADTTVNVNNQEMSVSNLVYNDGFNVAAYIKGSKQSFLGVTYWNYSAPTVTMQLQNSAAIDSATFTIVNPSNSSYNNVVTFTSPNTDVTTSLGYVVGGTGGDEKYPVGTQTFSQITVVKNGITFTVDLSNTITFEQPDRPSVLTYAGIPESYAGERPGEVSANGTTFVLTLPSIAWTATVEEAIGGEPVYSDYGNPVSLRTDYTYQYRTTIIWTTNRYYRFEWSRYTATATAEANIYTQTFTINSWIINGKTYSAGEEILINSEEDIIATAVVNEGEKVFVETKTTTLYKYKYGYVANGYQDSVPGGLLIKEVGKVNSWNANSGAPTLGPVYDDDSDYQQAWP